MFSNFGWIELIFFYGIAIGFGLWQYFKMDRELKVMRAEREAREAEETASKEPQDNERGPATSSNAASDKAA